MIKKYQHIIERCLWSGAFFITSLIWDRISFFCFYKFYYNKIFASYGENIRWGRDFYRKTIPTSVRISLPKLISIGNNCQIDEFVFLQCHQNSGGICIGEGSRINSFTQIQAFSNISIGKKVLIAPNVLISSGNHGTTGTGSIMERAYKDSGQIKIENGCWIGHGAKILGKTHLKENSIVGAGSITNSTYDKNAILVGIPAKKIK